MSIHPTITNVEVDFICNSLKILHQNIEEWQKEYRYDMVKNDYFHISAEPIEKKLVASWFSV